MYGVFLSQVIVLLLSKKRRFVLLEGYDLRKAHFYKVLLITWASAGFVWYVLFFKGLENVVKSPALFAAVGAQRLLFHFFPLLVLLVGQTTTIAVIGLSRDVPHFIRRILRRRAASPV